MQRPVAVTVFGVLNIVFGVLGFFGMIFTIATFFFLPDNGHNPVLEIMRNSPGYTAWMMIALPLGFLACGVSIAAGIGLLKLKGWARVLSIGYAIYTIVSCLVGAVLNYIFIMHPLMEQAAQKHGPEVAALIGGAIGGTFGSCIGMVYPVVLLIFMTRPKVAAAFRASAESCVN
jgi:hypothetical protein